MTRKDLKKKSTARSWQVTPGRIVINCSTREGGIRYERTALGEHKLGDGLRTEHRTKKTIDHVEAVAMVEALVKRADYACRAVCTNTILGWFCDDIGLAKLRQTFAELQEEAIKINAVAQAVGSQARAYISMVPLHIDLATPDAAREIARTIREVLTDVIAALRSGMVKQAEAPGGPWGKNALHAPLLRCKNLDRLAVGIAGESVKIALTRIPEAKKEVLERVKNGELPADVGASLDLSAIEAAIAWFAEGGITGADGQATAAVDEALQAGG